MAAVLGLGIIIGCICGLVVPSAAATDDVFIITSAEKIGTIELGEYPQTYVGNTRNANYIATPLTATGKKYTTYIDQDKVELIEYLLADGKTKVAKLPSAKWTYGSSGLRGTIKFSDNTEIINDETYFFDVEPIKFDLFATNGKVVAVAQNALGSMAFGTTNDWSQSAIRTFFHNNFATEAKLTGYTQAVNHYSTIKNDDRAGVPVTDTMWLPSASEMRVFYPLKEAGVRLGTDLTRATYTDDRGEYGVGTAGKGTIVYLRSAIGEVGVTGLLDDGIISLGEHTVFYNCRDYAYLPAFVLNNATAQYKTETIAATCTAGGYTESWWEINGQEFARERYNATPIIDHTFGEWETVTANTCVKDGELRRTCTVCDHEESKVLPATGHDYQTSFNANQGTTTFTCSVCGDSYAKSCDGKHDHEFVENVVPAQCGVTGYTEYTCKNCQYSYQDKITPALTHQWGDWHTSKEPTVGLTGTAERECTLCHATEQQTLPALTPTTGTTNNGGNNSGTVWLIFGIIAGGVLVLGGGAVSWLFIAGRQKKVATA